MESNRTHASHRAEAKFKAACEYYGLTLKSEYLGSKARHDAVCVNGHTCKVMPNNLLNGQKPCRQCTPVQDVFYIVSDGAHVKPGITSGDPRPRLWLHRSDGFTELIRIWQGLDVRLPQVMEARVTIALYEAGFQPTRGTEYYDLACLPLILDLATVHLGAGSLSARPLEF